MTSEKLPADVNGDGTVDDEEKRMYIEFKRKESQTSGTNLSALPACLQKRHATNFWNGRTINPRANFR